MAALDLVSRAILVHGFAVYKWKLCDCDGPVCAVQCVL